LLAARRIASNTTMHFRSASLLLIFIMRFSLFSVIVAF
jgi:hypothetical protein